MKDYRRQTGWAQVDGLWYYLGPNDCMIHDTTMDTDGVFYIFDGNGATVQWVIGHDASGHFAAPSQNNTR